MTRAMLITVLLAELIWLRPMLTTPLPWIVRQPPPPPSASDTRPLGVRVREIVTTYASLTYRVPCAVLTPREVIC